MHDTEDFYKTKIPLSELDDLLIKYDTVVHNSMNLWFTSNHDENSWNGSEYEKYGLMAPALAAFSFVWNGVPLIYSGQEMPNTKRLEFFDRDPINWNGQYELHEFYKTLTALKKNNRALRAGDENVTTYRLQTGIGNNLLAFLRKNGAHEVLSLFNFSNEKISFDMQAKIISGNYKNIFDGQLISIAGTKDFELQPWGFLIFEKI